MPRFVLLFHELPAGSSRASHWDLMLERGDALRTWALAQELRPAAEISCESLPDHRMAYLDYEGPVSQQRGQVTRVDRGTYEMLEEAADHLRVRLEGERYRGELQLQRVESESRSAEANQSWVVCFFLPESDA